LSIKFEGGEGSAINKAAGRGVRCTAPGLDCDLYRGEIDVPTRDSTTPIRGVFYGRMSSDQQEHSIAQQTEWAECATEREGVTIVARFVDEGIRGHDTRRRTAFHQMLAFCKECHSRGEAINAIVCYHANRFSRADSHETNWFLWEYRQAGVDRILTAQRWFHFDKLEDRIILGIEQEATCHKFSLDHAWQTTRGKMDSIKKGFFGGGPIPYGYRVQYPAERRPGRRQEGKLVIHEEESAVIRWLFEGYAGGETSLWQLVESLNDRKVAVPSSRRRGQPARGWNHRTLKKILTNEVYLGNSLWNRRHEGKYIGVVDLQVKQEPNVGRHMNPERDILRVDETHPPLVDRDTFDRCQEHLATRKTRTTPFRGGGDFLLSGLLVCGHCQRGMTGRNIPYRGKDGPRPAYRRYVCASYFAHGKAVCNLNAIDERPLVDAIATKISERFTPAFLAAFREEARRELAAGTDGPTLERARLRKALDEVEAAITQGADRLVREADERLLGPIRERVLALQDEKARLEAELARAEKSCVKRMDPDEIIRRAEARVRNLQKMLAAGTPAESRAALRDLVERVELFFGHQPAKKGRETRCTFVRGLVYLKEGTPLASCLGTTGASSSRSTG
jgi:site-specific DNA recombinase